MSKIRIGQTELFAHIEGSGVPLLLVHGFPLDHSMWRAQWEGLSDRYRVIAPDLRGFGSSSVTPGTVTMRQYADDLALLLDALEVDEPVALCGLSMGGYVALQFWRHHVQRLTCLILCDTRSAADSEETVRGRRETAQNVLTNGPASLVEGMIPKLFSDQTLQRRPEVVEQTQKVIASTDPEGIAAALHGMAARPNMTEELASIDVPALVICGERDAITGVEEMQKMADALPQGRFVKIADAGHMSPLEAPQRVNAAIRQFLEEGI